MVALPGIKNCVNYYDYFLLPAQRAQAGSGQGKAGLQVQDPKKTAKRRRGRLT
jgi:hypothetical protein